MRSLFAFYFLLFINLYTVIGQKKDTVKINLKHSNVLIVTESEENNEWDFSEELNEKENQKKGDISSTIFNIGIPILSNNIKPWESSYDQRIPFESTSSNIWGYATFRKLFSTLNERCTFFSGMGMQILNLGLEDHVLNNNSTLEFSKDSLFNPTKNKLRCNYIQVPILIGFQPFLHKKPRFQLQIGASFNYRVKSLLITKEQQQNNWIKSRIKDDFHFAQYYFNYHFNIIFKRLGIFSQFSLNPVFSDNDNDYLFSTGILISTFR